jgi:hypothetical protein
MRRKLVTAFELLVISFLLIAGVITWSRRNEPKTVVYPASGIVRAPLAPHDTIHNRQ